MGEKYSNFSHYLTGRNKVSYELLLKIYEAGKHYNKGHINLGWLLTGELPERLEDRNDLDIGPNQDRDFELINDFRRSFLQLDRETRSKIRSMVEILKSQFDQVYLEARKTRRQGQYPHAASPGILKEERLTKAQKRAIKKDVRDALRAVSEDEERENQK